MFTTLLLDYFLRFLPGAILGVILLLLLPKKEISIRILIYIMLFILIRDTMTPLNFWSFGRSGFFWIRFAENPRLVIVIGLASALTIFVINYYEGDLKKLLVWYSGNAVKDILMGIVGAFIVIFPLAVVYSFVPLENRGGIVPTYMLIPIFVLALFGNFYEEALFRGYLQGYLEKNMGVFKAALLSGVLFGFGHSFLAITVTGVGTPLLIFATYEGIIAGVIRAKYGLIGATITHGIAIFILASGLI